MNPRKKVDLKLIIVGALGVGKTSLLHQYVHKTFFEEYQTTLGASILSKIIILDDTTLKLQVSQEVVHGWCKEKDMPYFEVSAKNDINVVQAFEVLASRALLRYQGTAENHLIDSIKLSPGQPKSRCC
ncbi:ras-related protein Rab-7b isoform X8 [Mus musculus]|nr:ras-related protein Rab-7b isoform X8 [Mus musculus]|eukprot:XP_006529496.1 PREDICTED: ras-related protein Rab-7b isoform X5 [Mus musculus]